MSRDPSPAAVQRAARRLDRRLVDCANAVERRPLRHALMNPWVIAGAIAAFVLLPRRFRKPALKAALPMALGLFKAR
jgi:hypothetical protein